MVCRKGALFLIVGFVLGFIGVAASFFIEAPAISKAVSENIVVAMGDTPSDPTERNRPKTYGLPPPSDKPLVVSAVADKIVVAKEARLLTLFAKDTPLKSYRIALGPAPAGHKMQEGDGKTPEGFFVISGRNPNSAYHLSLRVSYPSPADKEAAQKRGVSPGGDIMIHGLPNNTPGFGAIHKARDWTAGCIAITDTEIEELWRAVPNGAVIEIRP